MAREAGMDQDDRMKYRAPALDKGLDILEFLSTQSEGLTRAEIVKAIGRGPSEIYRMLETLVVRGYVDRLSGGDRYALSIKLFLLANRHPVWRRLIASAQPLLDAFARETLQSCHIVVPEAGAAVVIAQASPLDTWEFRVRVGARLDLVASASGATLIAFQDPALLPEHLASWGAADRVEEAQKQYDASEAIRQQGYRVGPSLQLLGFNDISAPIFGFGGIATSVVTCPYVGRPAPTHIPSFEDTRERLCDVARRLSIG